MKRYTRIICNTALTGIAALALMVISPGCGKDDKSTGTITDPVDYSPKIDDDVATSVAACLAGDNGGAADQLVDIMTLAGVDGLRATHLVADTGEIVSSPVYNPSTGTWYWSLTREYSSALGLYFARVERTYQWRFLKRNGHPQVTYIYAHDTAYTIELTIIAGSGWLHMPYLSQTLTGLSGQLVATGTNTNDISITGNLSRSALDTLTTRYAVRTLEHSSNLTITNMHCQRDTTSQPWRTMSGTATGTYSADIHFSSGDAYPEDTVSRDIGIALDTGVAAITVGDSTWAFDLRRAELR